MTPPLSIVRSATESLAARARCCRELLAMLVGAGQSAEVGALAFAHAGHKEAHVGLLRLRGAEECHANNQRRCDPNYNHVTIS